MTVSYGKTVTTVDNGSPYSHVALLDLYLAKVPRADVEMTIYST